MFTGKRYLRINYLLLLIGLVLIFALAACTPGVVETEEPVTEPEIETPATEEPEIQEEPVATAGPPTVLFVSGDAVDQSVFFRLENLLESLTVDSELQMVVKEAITAEMITPEVQVVIGVGTNLDLNGLAMSFPGVNFLAIGDPSATVADNLSLIGDPANDIRQQAFMAGYLSALLSADYKIAGLISADHPDRDSLGESFISGGRYYCGICQPLYPPYNVFPQWHSIGSGSGEEGFRPVLNNLSNIGVDVVYVQWDLAEPELLGYLDELGIKAIGDRSPDILRNNWVGTVVMDPMSAFEELWPDLIDGSPGVHTSAAIRLVDIDAGLISEGRLRFFNQTAEELLAGMISFEIAP